jgi:hypothetical protein
MSVKMIADKRKKPSRARLKVVREGRARVRAEELSALELFTRNQLVGIDFGIISPEAVVIHEPALSSVEKRILNESLYGAQKMTDFNQKFGF